MSCACSLGFLRWKLFARGRRQPAATKDAQEDWLAGSNAEWSNAEPSEQFSRNCDVRQQHVVRTADAPWVTSAHCFQCALNTVHECDDFGGDLHTFPGIDRKWLSAQLDPRVHYPRVRYIVSYPPNTPRLPYHDHPGGEEYIVFSGRFCDTNFASVEAPAFVRYPIGTHHAAMTRPAEGRSDILCWWGLMQATSSTESAQHVPLEPETLIPKRRAPARVDGARKIWPISKDGLESRIERWEAGASVELTFERPMKEIFVLRGALEMCAVHEAFAASSRRSSFDASSRRSHGEGGEEAQEEAAAEAAGEGRAERPAEEEEREGRSLAQGDWCSFAVAAERADFVVGPGGATLVIKELLPYDGWRRSIFNDARQGWHSWSVGMRLSKRGSGRGLDLEERSQSMRPARPSNKV